MSPSQYREIWLVHHRIEVIGRNIATAAIANSDIGDGRTPVPFQQDSILIVEGRDPMRSSSLQKCIGDRTGCGCALHEDVAGRSCAGRICGTFPAFDWFVDL